MFITLANTGQHFFFLPCRFTLFLFVLSSLSRENVETNIKIMLNTKNCNGKRFLVLKVIKKTFASQCIPSRPRIDGMKFPTFCICTYSESHKKCYYIIKAYINDFY